MERQTDFRGNVRLYPDLQYDLKGKTQSLQALGFI